MFRMAQKWLHNSELKIFKISLWRSNMRKMFDLLKNNPFFNSRPDGTVIEEPVLLFPDDCPGLFSFVPPGP